MKTNNVKLMAPDYYQESSNNNLNIKTNNVSLTPPDIHEASESVVSVGGLSHFDPKPYQKILGYTNVNTAIDKEHLDEYRALQQSGGRLIGNMLGQLGTTIVGDVVSGIGSVISMPRASIHALRMIWDDKAKADFDRVFTEGLGAELMKTGRSISEFGRKSMPIYQTKQAQQGGFAGGMGDATWWASMFPTVGSAVASMIPVMGSLKGLSLTAKGLQMLNSSNKFGRAANVLGRNLSSRTAQILQGGIIGAHMDVAMEIAHGRDEQIAYAKSLGMSDEEAVRFASEYAAEAYKDGILYGLVFNTFEMATLLNTPAEFITSTRANKFLKEGLEEITKKGSKATIGKIDDITLSKTDYLNSFKRKALDTAKMSITEGFEEMRVDLALQEGEVKAKEVLGVKDYRHNMSEFSRWADLASKANSWDSFIWGAIGGLTLGLARGVIQKGIYGKKEQEFEANRVTNVLNSLQKLAKVVETTDGTLDLKIVDKEVEITNPDGTTTKKIQPVINKPIEELMPTIIALSSESNSYSYTKNFLENLLNLNDQEFEEIYGDISKKHVVEALNKEFDIAARIINKNKTINVDPEVAPMIRRSLNTQEYMLHYYTEQRNKVQTELKRLHKLRERYDLADIDNKLDSLETQVDEYNSKIKSLTDTIVEIDNQIKSTKNNLRTNIENQVAAENDAISLEAEIKTRNIKLQDLYSQHRIAKARIFELSRDKKNSRKKAMKEAKAEFKRINKEISNIESEINNLEEQLKVGLTSPIYIHESLIRDAVVLEARQTELEDKREGLVKELEFAKNTHQSLVTERKEYRESRPRIAQQYDEAKAKNQTKNIDAQDTTEENLIKLNDSLNRTIDSLERSLTTDRKSTIDNLTKNFKRLIEVHNKAEKARLEQEKEEAEVKKKKEKEEKKKRRLGEPSKKEESTPELKEEGVVDKDVIPEDDSVDTNVDKETLIEITDDTEEFDDDSLSMILLQSDKNGTTYEVQTSPDNSQKGRILGVNIGTINITQGDTITLRKTVYKVEKIELIDDVISITLDRGGNKSVYTIEGLIENDISLIGKFDRDYYEQVSKIINVLDNNANPEQQLKYIIDHIGDIKKLISSNTRNIIVLNLFDSFLEKIKNIKESAFSRKDLKDKYLSKYKEVMSANNFDFPSLYKSITSAKNRANFINHVLNRIDLSSIPTYDKIITDTNGNMQSVRSVNKNNLIQSIISELQIVAQQLFTDDTIEFGFTKTFDFGYGATVNSNTIDILNEGFKNIAELEEGNIISNFKSIVDKSLFDIKAEFNNRVNELITHKLKTGETQTYIDDINNYLIGIMNNSEFKEALPLLNDIKEYLNTINNIVTSYIKGGSVSVSDVNKSLDFYEKLNSIVTSDTLKDLTDNIKEQYGINISNQLANNLLTGKLHTYSRDLTKALSLYHTVITTTKLTNPAESGSYIQEALDLLSDLDSGLDDLVETAKDAIEKGKNITTILSDELKSLITLFDEIIARMRFNNLFNIDTFNYESILLGILQLPGGYDMVRENYQNVFNALQVLFSNNSIINVNNLISTFGKYGNLDIESQTILNRLVNLKNNIDSDPFKSLISGGKYSIINGLNKNWINEFLDNNRIQIYERVNHEGMRRLTPAVYKELADSKVYDATTNTFKVNNINLFGETFTIAEVFDQLKQLDVDQEFNIEKVEIDDKEYFNIYKKLDDGRKFVIEQIGITDNDTYLDIPLSQTTENGTVYYSSVFGNNQSISTEIKDFISKGLTSKTYDVIKEFYQFFKKYEIGKKYVEHYDELVDILSKLQTLGNAGSATIESINQLIHRVDPEFEYDDLEMKHLETFYKIITPMFYNLRDVDKLRLNKTYINVAYNNLNSKLAQDFYHLQQLKSEYELDNNTTVILNGINKSPILYTDRKVTNNLDRVVTKDEILNGKPVIEIISRQPIPDGGSSNVKTSKTVSSLTFASNVKDDTISQRKMSKEDNHNELYVKIKSNNSLEGYSYIPIVRGTLQTINIDKDGEIEDLQQRMINQVISDISKLIVNPYYTFSEKSSPKQLENYYDILANLSKYVIVDEAKISDKGSGFFKVGNVFDNKEGGKNKKIVFRVGLPSSRSSHRLSTYEVTLDINYNTDDTINYINVYKNLISVKGHYHKNETPILSKKFDKFYKKGIHTFTRGIVESGIKKTISDSKTLNRHSIKFDKDSNVEGVLNSILGEIVGNMYRAVNTAWIEKRDDASAYGYGEVYYEQNEKGTYIRKYKSIGTTEPYTINGVKFDSYQDFLIKTGAVQISATAIKSKNGTVLSNYDITTNVPAMWFKTKSELKVENIEKKTNTPKSVQPDEDIIKQQIHNLEINSDNWFDELSSGRELYETLGIINKNTSNEAFDIIQNLFIQGIVSKGIKLVVNNKLDVNKHGAIITKNGVSTFEIGGKYLNNPAFNKLGFGALCIHEALHAYMNTLINTPEYDVIINKLKNLRKELVDATKLSLNDFNNKFRSDITENEYTYLKSYLDKSKSVRNLPSKLATQELITYALTDKTVANILNRMTYVSEEQTKESTESFWKKLINTLLEFLGIGVKNNTVLNEIKSIVENSYSVIGNVETNTETSYEAGVKPASLSAVSDNTTDSTDNTNETIDDLNIDLSDIEDESDLYSENLDNAGRDVGLTPALTPIENNINEILKNQINLLSSSAELVSDFQDKYTDALNEKIC